MAIQPFTPPQFGAQQQNQQPQTKRQRGTGFTNISRMLDANVGAGQQMGQKIGQTIGTQAGKVKEDVARGVQQFRTGYEEAKEKGLQQIGQVGSLASQIGEGGKVGAGLSGLSEDEAKRMAKEFSDVKYGGPMELGGQFGARTGALKGLAQSVTGGQRGLIGQTLAKAGPYSRGQSILDASLLGQSQAGQEALRSASAEAMKVASQAQQEGQAAQNLAKSTQGLLGTGQEKTGSLKSDVSKKLSEASGKLQEFGKEEGEKYKDQASKTNELLNQLASGQINKLSQLTEDQKSILDTLPEYGVSELKNLKGQSKDQLRSILKDMYGSFNLAEGASKFTKEQESALKNLALLGKDEQLVKNMPKQMGEAYSKETMDKVQAGINTNKENLKTSITDLETKARDARAAAANARRMAQNDGYPPGSGPNDGEANRQEKIALEAESAIPQYKNLLGRYEQDQDMSLKKAILSQLIEGSQEYDPWDFKGYVPPKTTPITLSM